MHKFQLLSDAHLEFCKQHLKPKVLAPNLILAGDIGKLESNVWKQFITYCSANWKQVFYIFGNHEFYHDNKSICLLKLEYLEFFDQYPNIHLLDNSSYLLDDIDIYGFVGWTRSPFQSQSLAQQEINDYNYIADDKGNLITPKFITQMAQNDIDKFKNWLSCRSSQETRRVLIITHFPPICVGTSNPIYLAESRIVNKYFSWENLLKSEKIPHDQIHTWISGHTHWSYDFIDSTTGIRYISNQMGYSSEISDSNFNPTLVLEI